MGLLRFFLHGEVFGADPLTILALNILLAISLVLLSFRRRDSGRYFRNIHGEHIQVVTRDTRFSRFTHGQELSREGLEKFPIDPYLVRNGSINELVIFNEAQVREFFAGDAKGHTRKHDCNFGSYWARMLGQCVGVQNGETWHTSRRHMDPHLAFSAAASRIEDFRKEFKSWAATLSEDPAVGEKTDSGFCIDGVAACRQLPFKLIAMALYGDMLTEDIFRQLWDLNKVHEEITYSAFLEKWPTMRFYHWLPTKANRAIRSYEEEWMALNLQIIAEARKTNTHCATEKIYQGVELGDMTMSMFLQSIDESLFTNIDVTSSMFACSLISLGRNPQEQISLRKEIESQEGDIATYAQKETTLLHKTYLEVLRLNPPVWFTLPEVTAKEKRIGGFLIPAKTCVIIDCSRLNKLSSIWGTDGHIFRPERFAGLSSTQIRYSMIGYGMGHRKCLGKNFANLIIKMLIITILQDYDLSVEGEDSTMRRDRFTCVPEEIVHFRKRQVV